MGLHTKTQEKRKKKNTALSLLVGMVVITAVGSLFTLKHLHDQNAKKQIPTSINLSPATKQDVSRDNANKQRIVDQQNSQSSTTPPPAGTKQTVTPVITFAGNYGSAVQVGGYVDVFEQGGTCTVTFTQGSTTITRSVAAVENATNVNCPEISVSINSFDPKGAYNVTLSYSSTAYAGTSDTKKIEVQQP